VPLSGAESAIPARRPSAVSVSGGSALADQRAPSGYPIIEEGSPLSIIHGGRRYLYFADDDAAASGGSASIQVYPLIRTALTAGDTSNCCR
jgi:hypothetical protein